MKVVSSAKLREALVQVTDLGLHEEPFEMLGQSMVVRNLRPEEHNAVLAECEGLDNLPYMTTHMMGNVSRALVELNGVDLREVSFVEDEVPDEKGRPKKVRLEKHKWLEKNVLSLWRGDALYLTYLKVQDAILVANRRAREGITFITPEETDEAQVRRLFNEAKDLLDGMPEGVKARVLEDYGFADRPSEADFQEANAKLAATPPPAAPSEPEYGDETEDETEVVAKPAPEPVRDEDLPAEIADLRASIRQVPRQVPRQPLPVSPETGSSRTAEHAALAEAAIRDLGLPPLPPPEEVPTVVPRPPPDAKKVASEVASILDQPPVVGRNPKFRPPR